METIILYFLCFLIEAVILFQYAACLFESKRPVTNTLFMLCILYTVLFLASLFNIKWLNMVLYLLANFIFLAAQYRIKLHVAFFHSVLVAAVMGMCELSVYNLIEHFTPRFFVRPNHFHNTIVFLFFSKILFFTIIYIITHFLKQQQKSGQQHDYSIFFLMLFPAATVFIMLTFVTIGDHFTLTPTLDWMVSLGAGLLLVSNLFVFGINQHNQKKSREYTEMQLLLQKESSITEYYKMVLSQSENQSILIHDIKKHLQSIELLNEQNDRQKISAYIQQLLLSSDLKEDARICDHEMLNAILLRYKRQCDDNHITFITDIRTGTTNFLSDSELTSLYCNLLENAIEAAGNIQDSYIEINTAKRENTPFVVITVINSCPVNPFTTRSGNLLVTHKSQKHKHGFGLKSIQKIVKRHHGDMRVYYNDDTLTFHTIITLKEI